MRSSSRLNDKGIKIKLYINLIKAIYEKARIINDKNNIAIIIKNLSLYRNIDINFIFEY